MIQYVISGNDVGILIDQKNDRYKILTDAGGDPGYIYSRSAIPHIPEGVEKATLDRYYGYYQTVLKHSPLAKASLVPQKVWAHPKNGRPYITTVYRSTDTKTVDEALYGKIISGDQNALASYVFQIAYKGGEHSPYLKKTIGRMSERIDVDDVVQEVGMAMLNHQKNGSLESVKKEKLQSYIGGAFHKTALRHYKHYRRMTNAPEENNRSTHGEDVEGDILLYDAIRSIEKEIMESSGKKSQSKVSIFRQYITGGSYAEIGDRMNMSSDSIKYHLKNINNAIRQAGNKNGMQFQGSPLGNLRTIFAKRQFDPRKLEKAARRLLLKYEFQGLPISVESHPASERSGVDLDGNKWSVVLNQSYGYIRGTMGADGDHVDCFIGPNQNSGQVYVIHQNNPDGSYDEDKVMLGFNDRSDARSAYLSNYDRTDLLGDITEMTMDEFKQSLSKCKGKRLEKSEMRTLKMPSGKLLKVRVVGILEKAKSVPVGTESTHGGQKVRKTSRGWVRIGADKKPEKPEKGQPKERTPDQVSKEKKAKRKQLRAAMASAIKSMLDTMSEMFQGKEAGEELAAKTAEYGKKARAERAKKKEKEKEKEKGK
jgi:DNA-directed RNA polymerase specialized sigma24 family protein